jgi:hypothetical protein
MRKTIITCTLDLNDIARAIKELKAYKQDFLRKEKELLKGLVELGLNEASVRFTTAAYDGINDVSVRLDGGGTRYIIEAKGEAVAFIEFGTGVYYNPSEPYPEPRPDGIVGIGEYGEGYGKRKAWGYEGEPGTNGKVNDKGIVITRGNPAAMPMWYASEEMRNSVTKLVKEVYG